MRELKPSQLKALSEFLNTIAAAWFSAGVIAPIFTEIQDSNKLFRFFLISAAGTLLTLSVSLYLIKDFKYE